MAAGTCPTRRTPRTWRSCASGACCASSGNTSLAAAGSSSSAARPCAPASGRLAPPRLRDHRRCRPAPAGAGGAGGRRSADVLRQRVDADGNGLTEAPSAAAQDEGGPAQAAGQQALRVVMPRHRLAEPGKRAVDPAAMCRSPSLRPARPTTGHRWPGCQNSRS